MSNQRYVSNELSHFVGRGKSDDEQYDILVNKILKSGWLTYPPHEKKLLWPRPLHIDLNKPLSENNPISEHIICFCDIPVSDLEIHTKKYSKFGLSFTKKFLIHRMARPVLYVPSEVRAAPFAILDPDQYAERIAKARMIGIFDQALVHDILFHGTMKIIIALSSLIEKPEMRAANITDVQNEDLIMKHLFGIGDNQISQMKKILGYNPHFSNTLRCLSDFFVNAFSYIKFFSVEKDFEDIDNYYMEREWRVPHNIEFKIDDVMRIFFPSKYAQQFRKDMPEYFGQISFID